LWTLEDCVNYGIENSPLLQSDKLNSTALQYQIRAIKAQALPQVSINGSYNYNYALAEQILPGEVFGMPGQSVAVQFGVANTLVANIEATQLLFDKRYKSSLKAAQENEQLTQLNIFQSTENLVYDIVNIYLNINLTEKSSGLLKSNLNRIEKLITISQIQYEEGLIKKIDVDQLLVNLANIISEQRTLHAALKQQINLLKLYIGIPISTNFYLADFALEEESYDLNDSLDASENTDLKVLDKQAQLLSLEDENIRAGYYPTLSAFANYGWQGQTDRLFSSDEINKLQGTPTGVAGLRLSIPLFDGFRKKNERQKLEVEMQQLKLTRQNLVNSVEMAYDNANETLKQNRIILNVQIDNISLAEALYEASKLSYQEGVAPLTELLNAETSLKEAQTQYLRALLNVKIAELEHLKSSGQLSKLVRTTQDTSN